MRRCLSTLLLCLAAAVSARAQGTNANLDDARKLLAAGNADKALAELDAAASLQGNSIRQLADISALRAWALIAKGGAPAAAEAELVQMFHLDPSGGALATLPQQVKERAGAVRSARPLVLHERLVVVRTGRPLRVRAQLSGASSAQLTLSFRVELEQLAPGDHPDSDEFVRVPMEPSGEWFEATLRPGVGAWPASGEHVVDYFLKATAPSGALLDSNGTARDPIRVKLSPSLAEAAGLAALDEGGKPAHAPEPPPSVAWYKRWQIVAPAAVLIVGGTVAAILLQPKPQPMTGSLGRVDLP